MSAATDLFAPDYDPDYDPDYAQIPVLPRRHLTAVPDAGDWSTPVRVAPAGAASMPASVSTLHAPEPASVPLRLTRRGVVALSLLVVALGAALVWLAALSSPEAAPAAAPATAAATVTVQQGDTLWSIAGRVAPGVDPRAEVDTLRRLNDLDGVALVPGQQLRTR